MYRTEIIVPQERKLVRGVRMAVRDEAPNFEVLSRMRQNFADSNNMPFGMRMRAQDYQRADGKWVRQRAYDSSGAFMVGELERLDQRMHAPLVSVFWSRDIDLREDVTLADEVSAYTLSTFASGSGLGASAAITAGKAWAGKNVDQVGGVGIDIAKITNPLTLWMRELKYTIPELESAAKLGRPIDQQKYDGMMLKNQMDIDAMVYVGDTDLGVYGLFNSNNRSGLEQVSNVANVAAGLGGSTWTVKTPNEILLDVNEIITSAWAATGWSVMPSRLMLPPTQFGYISTQPSGLAANQSILKYLMENSVRTSSGLGKLEILPSKWLVGAGQGGTIGTAGTVDRMCAYTKDPQRVRFPMTTLLRTPVQYDSIYHKSTYYGRLGVLEIVYPETMAYRDGI